MREATNAFLKSKLAGQVVSLSALRSFAPSSGLPQQRGCATCPVFLVLSFDLFYKK